jgi:HK97 family phage portal protein
VKLPRWLTPWRKHTDQNTVTPLRMPYSFGTPFGVVGESFPGSWQTQMRLDDTNTVLANSAVYACLSLISGDIAKLRPMLMRRRADGTWEEFENPAYSPVLRRPNRYQTWFQFIEQWVLSKLIHGNTYVYKDRDERNVVTAMYVLHPSAVMPVVAPDGEVLYRLGTERLAGLDQQPVEAFPASEIIHDRAKTLFHPLLGVAPLYASALSATQGRRIQTNSSVFFQNMSRPSGLLTAPGHIPDDVAERLKRDWEERFGGQNMGRTAVAGDGLDYKPFTMPAEQAQLIQQLGWTTEDVARAFLVPLYKISAQKDVRVDPAMKQEYYEATLQPYIEAIEALLWRGLGLQLGVGVELDTDGLLRMDPKTRAETNQLRVQNAIMTPNEARKQDNLPPKKGGDELYIQEQNYSLPAIADRDNGPDPFGKGATPAPAANDSEGNARAAKKIDRAITRIAEELEVA